MLESLTGLNKDAPSTGTVLTLPASVYFVDLKTSHEGQRRVSHAEQASTRRVPTIVLHWHWDLSAANVCI
jgi:hypothetical protein